MNNREAIKILGDSIRRKTAAKYLEEMERKMEFLLESDAGIPMIVVDQDVREALQEAWIYIYRAHNLLNEYIRRDQ